MIAFRHLALAAFFLLALPSPARAVEPVPAVKIAPHRALYKMELASARNGSNISDVMGTMALEWADACDGWAVQQQIQLRFTYAGGDESETSSTLVTWESKDGWRYNFNLRRLTGEEEPEVYRGHARMAEQGGEANYTTPKGRKTALPPDAMFPSAHTKLILQKAQEGEKLFTRRVFDGSDEAGMADISAFLRPATEKEAQLDKSTRDHKLIIPAPWAVRLAFFKPEAETGSGEPDYEMDLILQANGVARSLRIDYGDFSVLGTLTKLEALPKSGC